MNFTGNGDIKDEYLEIITHRHSGPIKDKQTTID